MPKINVLDKQTAELIAAGEVVERPASIIKELLENSIDSGASKITVEIQNGGKTYIRVSDNGCGISPEDLPKAVLRHATSKIKVEEDLNNILTLGFRGEALASIAAVSKMQILSCTESSEIGARIELNAGEVIYCGEAGSPKGTTVVVRDLFYNTPARMKFMKKDSTEASYIQNICEKIFISYPGISFSFIKDGVNVINTPGDGKLISAIYSVYGKEFTESLTETEYYFDSYSVKGYISKPTASRANRNMQLFYVNNRYVKSKTLYAAIEEAYKGSIMTGKFPACVLFIDLPTSLVDVNVHPAKTEIRFADEKSVFHSIYHATHAGLSAAIEIPKRKEEPVNQKIFFEPVETVEQAKITPEPQIKEEEPILKSFSSMFIENNELLTVRSEPLSADKLLTFTYSVKPEEPIFKPEPELEVVEKTPVIVETEEKPKFKYLGQVFGTYILGQYGDSVLFIDKHAAHERLIYNSLKEQTGDQASQILLSPIKVTLGSDEIDSALNSAEKFIKLGFSFDEFGASTIVIREAPVNIQVGEIKEAFLEILDLIMNNSKRAESEIFDELLHSIACRAAVKAHDKSSDIELEAFANKVIDSDARYCPHGRPVIIKFTKTDIEKKFFRIV